MTAQQLIAIDPDALEEIMDQLTRLHTRLDRVEMRPKPEWLTINDYAEYVEREPRTVRNWINAGTVQTKKDGRRTMVRINPAA